MKTDTLNILEYYDQFLKFASKEINRRNIDEAVISYLYKMDLKICLNNLIEKQEECNKVFYYYGSESAESYLAFGSVFKICENGEERFIKTENGMQSVFKRIIDNHSSISGISIPLFLGAAKFDYGKTDPVWNDFGDSEWFIPKYLVINKGNENFLVINSILKKGNTITEISAKEINEINKNLFDKTVSPEQSINTVGWVENKDEDHEWLIKVNKAIELIKLGEIRKVVLSRKKTIRFDDEVGLSKIYKKLSGSKSICTKYLYKSGGSIFIGCSPEKLFNINKNILKTEAVAGSIKRGLSTEDDDQLSLSLLSSSKEIKEHRYVVDFLLNRMKKYSDKINYPDKLQIKKTEQLQHLWLPLQCELSNKFSLFGILNDLFPTPAVCGIPKEDAHKLISRLESFNRGLFAGIIGWFNKNEADMAVGIRSALIYQNEYHLFAGCGIVAASDPVSEYNETELKMETILSILKDEN